MRDWLRSVLSGRPAWMNALMGFCAYMAFVYVPWDFLLKPAAQDEEVWFGIVLHGAAAKLTEPLHWAIYAAGFYGFLRMRPWMFPWAAVYAGQVAIGMLIWPVLYQGGVSGVLAGLVAFAAFGWLTLALWRAEPRFTAPSPTLRERYGEWALVTGASSGIGAEFARALARDGLSCVLTARRSERLEALAEELAKTWQVQTRVVAADLADPAEVERLADAVSDLEIGVLVNNAGFGYAGRFDKQDAARLRDMVQLNCLAPVLLTHRLLPGMLGRGRGAVIEPGSTETEFQAVAGETPHAGEPADRVVAQALRALGRQPSVISGWWNWLRANAAARLAPRSFTAFLARDVVVKQTPPRMR